MENYTQDELHLNYPEWYVDPYTLLVDNAYVLFDGKLRRIIPLVSSDINNPSISSTQIVGLDYSLSGFGMENKTLSSDGNCKNEGTDVYLHLWMSNTGFERSIWNGLSSNDPYKDSILSVGDEEMSKWGEYMKHGLSISFIADLSDNLAKLSNDSSISAYDQPKNKIFKMFTIYGDDAPYTIRYYHKSFAYDIDPNRYAAESDTNIVIRSNYEVVDSNQNKLNYIGIYYY